MERPFTISFFIDEVPIGETIDVFEKVFGILPQYFNEHEKIFFLHCADNMTDSFVHKIVMEIRRDFPIENYPTVKVYPYCREGHIKCAMNNHIGAMYYEKHWCFKGADSGNTQTAHITRNKKMVDISDLSFFAVKEKNTLSDETLKYAKEHQKEIIIL